MLPDLFKIPIINLPIHTYGVMIVFGLAAAMCAAHAQASRSGYYQEDIVDFAFWALLGGLLGARLLFIMVEWRYYFVEEPFSVVPGLNISIPTVLAVWKGGLVFYGAALGGVMAIFVFCKKRKIEIAKFSDLVILVLPLGHAMGRLGCVAAGCCYGRDNYHIDSTGEIIANTPFSLAFPKVSIAYGQIHAHAHESTINIMNKLGTTVPLFPVQLLESFGEIIIFFILLLCTPIKRAHGQIALTYFILYSVLRAFTETFRGDIERGFVFGGSLSTSQFIAVLTSIFALFLIAVLQKREIAIKKQISS